jgi:hypothetical protein
MIVFQDWPVRPSSIPMIITMKMAVKKVKPFRFKRFVFIPAVTNEASMLKA